MDSSLSSVGGPLNVPEAAPGILIRELRVELLSSCLCPQKGGHGSWSALGTLPGLVLTSGMLGSVSSEDNGHEDTTGGSSVHASICPLEKRLLNTSCVPGLSGRNDNYDGSPGPRDSAMFSPLSVSPTHLDAFHPVPPHADPSQTSLSCPYAPLSSGPTSIRLLRPFTWHSRRPFKLRPIRDRSPPEQMTRNAPDPTHL